MATRESRPSIASIIALTITALCVAGAAHAQSTVILDPGQSNRAIGITELNIGGTLYDVEFANPTEAVNVYGELPGSFDFNTSASAEEAVDAVVASLNAAGAEYVGAEGGPNNTFAQNFAVAYESVGTGTFAAANVAEGGFASGNWLNPGETDSRFWYADSRTYTRFTEVSGGGGPSPPQANFSYTPSKPEPGQEVQFYDSSSGDDITSWEWDFDDGGSSTDQHPIHTFAVEGSYSVSLTATNSGGEDSTEINVDVKGEEPPVDPDPDFGNLYFVPSASHAGGAQGSFWLTDMDINNGGDESANFKLVWLPRDTDNSSPTTSQIYTLEAGAVRRFEDVVNSVFDINKGYGALAVTSDSSELYIFSRTFNSADSGSYGTAVPGVAYSDVVRGDTRKRLLFFTEDNAFRSNVAFQNGTGYDLVVKWELFDADGDRVDSGETPLQPWSNTQENQIFSDQAPIEAAYMDVWTETSGGAFMVFSSVVDNGTGDGTVVQPQITVVSRPN